MTLRTAQNIFLPKNINAVTNCIENSTVSRGIWEDVTNSGNGERGTGNREPESGNKCTAATLLRIQNGGQHKRKDSKTTNLG